MDNSTNNSNGLMKIVVPVAVLAIIVVAVIFFYTSNKTPGTQTESVSDSSTTNTQEVATDGVYADGTYDETGSYVSPGGPREVNVSLTVTGDVITDASFEGLATDPTSVRFQKEFADNYKTMIVGKKISDVNLTKVAGSSLTPKGFNDALEKIKAKAQA